MLLAIDFDEDFIDVERITIAPVLPFQSAGINGPEFDTPETDRFSGYGDAPFSEQIFNIPVAQIEAVVQPDSVAGRGAGHPNSPPFRTHRAQFGQ